MASQPIKVPENHGLVMGVSLRTLLLVPFVLQVVGITSLIGYLSYATGQRATEDLAEQLVTETGERITQNLDYYFNEAAHLVRLNQFAVELETLNWQNLNLVEKHFVKQLQVHPSIGALSIATEEQDFLTVARATPDRLVIQERDRTTGQLESYIADESGSILYHHNSTQDFDPHAPSITPWYKTTRDLTRGIWLPVVTSADTGWGTQLQIGRFEAFYNAQGQVQGVFSAAFSLDQIGHFLDDLKISDTGQVFILDERGCLVATSTAELPLRQELALQPEQSLDPRLCQLPVEASQNPVTRSAAAWERTLPTPGSSSEPDLASFKVGSQRYFGYRLPLTMDGQPEWTVVMAIPASDFTATIDANNRRTLLLCGVGLLSSVGFGLWIVRRVTRPLEQLDQTLQTYAAEGTFQPPRAAGVREIDSLGQTLKQMVAHLDAEKHHMAVLYQSYAESLQTQVETKTQELQAATAKLQEAQRIAQMGSWELDGATGAIVFSDSLLNLLKDALPDANPRYPEILEMVHREDRAAIQEAVEAGIQKGLTGETEIRIPRADGTTQYLASRSKAIYDEQGVVVRLVGTATDITDRKLAEVALKDSNTRLRQALEISKAVVWEHDLSTHELVFSSTTTNSEPQRMSYEDVLALVHPEDQPLVRQANETVVNELGSYDIEHRGVDFNRPHGWRWFQVNARVITDAANHPVKILGMSMDVSDRKQAELALRESEARFATIFHDNPAPAWIAKLEDGLVLDVNRRFCSFLGCSAADVIGHTCTDLPLWDNPDDCHRLRQLLNQYSVHRNYQTLWRTNSGEPRTVLLSTKVVSFHGEACVIGVVNDITDRQETENMLRQLSQQLLTWRDRYEVAIWAGRQIIYEYDALTDSYTWGRNTQDILGYDLDEMPQTLEECVGFIHPTEQQAFLDMMADSEAAPDPCRLEFRVLKQDGTYLWMEDQGVPQVNDQGKLVRVIGAFTDISERKRGEAERKQSEAERAHMIDLLKQSEANYLGILQHQTELVTRFTRDGILLFVNEAFCDYYGVSWDQVVGHKYSPNIYPADKPAIDPCLESLSPTRPICTVQHRSLVKGEVRWMEWTTKAIYDDEGNFVELQSVGRDIHDRRQTEIALKESQAKFQRLVDDIGDKFVVFSQTGDQGILTYVSDGIEPVFGVRKTDVLGQPWDQVIPWEPEDVTLANNILGIMQNQQLDSYQFDMGFAHPEKEHRIVTVSLHLVKDAAGNLVAIEGIVEDITDRRQSEQELKALNARLQNLNRRLEELATLDSLTQVANRRKMEQVLHQEWHRCQRETQPLSLILLDIDFFKSYNDHYGHPKGDWCLQQVAQILQACMKRPGDLVARYGGEEFLLILPNTKANGAMTIAENIQSGLASLAILHEYSLVSDRVTVSLGIAVARTIPLDLSCSEAVALADKALYQAKQVRNTFHVEVMS
jgi:diguanylate cyclase (GGDEF)-like protein/PAS domain S-box-containing protein